MGSKDSFAGGGGNIGNDLREGIDDWLANLPGSGGVPPTVSPSPQADSTPAESATARLTPRAQRVARTSLLFKTASGTGSKARRGTDAQFPRSAATSARIAGRGAAAAYAYRTGDRDTLRDLGLDYDSLRANPNVLAAGAYRAWRGDEWLTVLDQTFEYPWSDFERERFKPERTRPGYIAAPRTGLMVEDDAEEGTQR